jgi:hypothetical protein
MRSLPKPLIGLLLSTLVFFSLWYVELRPSSSTSGGSPNGVGQYQSAINQAHQAVATSNAANAKLGAPTATGPAPKSPTPAKATAAKATPAKAATTSSKATSSATPTSSTKPAAKAAPAAKPAAKPAVKTVTAAPAPPTPAAELANLATAVAAHKVVVVLFYNPAASDDQAMVKELDSVPAHSGQVFKLAVPVSELTEFQAITAQVPVVTAPTMVVIDPARQASMITGYASQLELNQRVADALAAK